MRLQDEIALWNAIKAGQKAWEAYAALGQNERAACATLEKWERQGCWECGVSTRTGWLLAGVVPPRLQGLVEPLKPAA